MIKRNLHEIKVQLSKYIDLVEGGETIIVCKRNVPVAEIRPLAVKEMRVPVLGSASRKGRAAKSPDSAMTKDELRLWEEGHKDDPLKKYAPRAKARR